MVADPVISKPLRVEVRRGACAGLAELLRHEGLSTGGPIAVAVGTGHGALMEHGFDGLLPLAEVWQIPGPTLTAARGLVDRFAGRPLDVLVGVGGGGTLDVAKYAATELGVPMVTVATNLAHDGLASPVASLVVDGRKVSLGVRLPVAVLVDLDHVARSPIRQTRSGVGDVVSNLSAIADWQLAHQLRGEPMDDAAVTLATMAARAVLQHAGALESDAFLANLANSLVLSGSAMAVAGSSRPCSGACHEISHAIDARFPGLATHGEQVAVGTMFAMFLSGHPALPAVDDCFRRHGVPRTPADLGLTVGQFVDVVELAPSTRPDRWTILEHLNLSRARIRGHVEEFAGAVDC